MKLLLENWRKYLNEELNEEDALEYFRAQTDKDASARQNTDAVFFLDHFFGDIRAAFDNEDADELRAMFERGWDNEAKGITGPIAMIEQLSKIDPAPEGLSQLAAMLKELDGEWVLDRDIYGDTGKVDGYLTRDDNLEAIIRLINGIYPATTVDVESDAPTSWADRTMATDPSLAQTAEEPAEYRISPYRRPKK